MQYIISGGQPLSGKVKISGAKNASLKLIVAALLINGKSTIHNVPRIVDIFSLIEIINYLGGEVKFVSQNTVTVENKLTQFRVPLEIAGKTRVSILLLAPLLYTFGQAILPNPGGCRLGERSVDRLINSVIQMGANIKYNSLDGYYYAKLLQTRSAQINFKKKSHTGTELALMFASRINKKIKIKNAALEPEIDDLIAFLNNAGAQIKRQDSDINIIGSKKLKNSTIVVQPDRIEAATFIVLSCLFDGKIIVQNIGLQGLKPFLKVFSLAGFKYKYNSKTKEFRVLPNNNILPTDITTAPHPGFLTDWQPLWTILMTQAHGVSTVHETVFENRLGYVKDLNKFGAKISFYKPTIANPEQLYQFNNFDPLKHRYQAVKINGPKKLHNAYAIMTDIRAGACLVIAGLIAQGRSVIDGAQQIERGYEDMPKKLMQLGADIKVVKD